eukprot:6186276-Pleurochrysis_carterae.AAC.5
MAQQSRFVLGCKTCAPVLAIKALGSWTDDRCGVGVGRCLVLRHRLGLHSHFSVALLQGAFAARHRQRRDRCRLFLGARVWRSPLLPHLAIAKHEHQHRHLRARGGTITTMHVSAKAGVCISLTKTTPVNVNHASAYLRRVETVQEAAKHSCHQDDNRQRQVGNDALPSVSQRHLNRRV